ncbi:DUF6973 domain-containing protein [Telluria beijingensis]|uniref:DUF6973 domain-containing protein n=1 Tax=Telluria beijingensis TaxID=3068633 RepID=UPI002795FD08|nr:hypothetical protein [Massilia sp. REN29]
MTTTYSDSFQKLTASEKIHLAIFPEQIAVIKRASQRALLESEPRFPGDRRNTPGDAFRHCFWSALLARDIEYASALRYTNAHEAFPDNPPDEKAMDLHNNAVGLNIGRYGGPNQILILRCMEALRSGRLKVIER